MQTMHTMSVQCTTERCVVRTYSAVRRHSSTAPPFPIYIHGLRSEALPHYQIDFLPFIRQVNRT